MTRLYASSLIEDNWNNMGTWLDKYWLSPIMQEDKWWNLGFSEYGNLLHDIVQTGLWKAKVLHSLHDGTEEVTNETPTGSETVVTPCFKELKIINDFYGVSGRVDLLAAAPKLLKKIGAKTPPKEKIEIKKWAVGDIKTIYKHVYDEMYNGMPELIKDTHKAQITFYHDHFVEEGIVDKDTDPFFVFSSRDDLRNQKYVSYKPEQYIRDLMHENCITFWTHVANRTHPDKKDYEKYTEECIAAQPDRIWTLIPGCVSFF